MEKTKKEDTRKQAYQLARTGNHMNWQSIEWTLRNEVWDDARSILNDEYIREELNKICEEAQSPSEVENRTLFNNWIKNFIDKNVSVIKEKYPTVSIYTRDNMFSISSATKEIELVRKFNSKEIQGDYFHDIIGGQRLKSINYYHSEKPFDEFVLADLFELVEKVL